MFQSRLYGISAFFLACISCSLLCASNVEAKSIEDRSWSNSNPRLVQAANRRDETIEIVSHRGVVSEEIEVHVPEASFVKLHFSKFELPHGVIIEVSNPGGTEVYRYSNSWKDALTFDPLLEDGVTSFSAMSISGDTALIRVLGRHGLVRPGEHGVEIDYLMEGLPERAVVGLDDLSGTGSQTQGPFNPATIAGPAGAGSYDLMRVDVNFSMNGGNDAYTFNGIATVVPEPGTGALLALGLLALALPRRR